MIIWNADLGNAKREVAAFAAVADAQIMTADDDGAIRAVKHRHSQVPFLPHGTSRNPSTLASIRSNLPDELLVGSRELQEELKDRLDNGGLFRTPRAIEFAQERRKVALELLTIIAQRARYQVPRVRDSLGQLVRFDHCDSPAGGTITLRADSAKRR